MNTFIFLGCVPVPEWQHKIDFVTKTVLDKENTYILVRKIKNILPPQRTPLGVWESQKIFAKIFPKNAHKPHFYVQLTIFARLHIKTFYQIDF